MTAEEDQLDRSKGWSAGRAAREQKLLAEIRRIHTKHRYYGSPRVHQELLRSHRVGRRWRGLAAAGRYS